MWSINDISNNIHQWLSNNFSPTWTLIFEMVIIGLLVMGMFAMLGLVLVLMERKVSAWMQIRLGPNRVGPKGMFQTLADTMKLMVKEGLTPNGADKILFNIAPFIAMIVAMLLMAPIAFAKDFQMWDLNIGVLYVSAVSSMMVISILIAGWSSNNKYSLLGAMRSGAQIVSYELSAGLSILAIVVFSGSLQVSDIINSQADGWWIFKGHIPAIIAFITFIIAVTAETNRAPFDLAEAESELTAGFHTEYSGMKFALFFLAEYVNVFIVCGIGATLFLGGWMPLHIGNWIGFNHVMDYIPSSIWFFWKNFLFDLYYYVVQMDFPEIADRSVAEPGVEIFITDQYGEPGNSNRNCNFKMAFLTPMFITKYLGEVWRAVRSLLKGMRRTGYYFTHHKEIITQQYPDNRASLKLADRFKGEVVMPHDENNEHRCTGCQACEIACPNGTIKVITQQVMTADGRKKKAIDKLVYHLELCTMCNLCIIACPSDAIKMAQTFEHSVFDRSQLTKVLNKPGSKIMEGVE